MLRIVNLFEFWVIFDEVPLSFEKLEWKFTKIV